jgi:chromosome segregation ATPase
MMINTLNIEKAEELEKIELQYRNELAMSEEKQRVLENSLNESKEFIKKLQRQLDLEIQKKEEMEDELMQKGSGHEEEVSTRIKFESKVNQMYAKQRDMETVAQNMRELIQELQSSLENKSDLLSKERKKYEEVLDSKLKFENENLKIEEKLKQLETNFNGLTKRLEESYLKIEELSKNLTTYTTMYSESQNDITQRKIELEDKKFEIEIKNSTIQKLEKAIDELRLEKNVLVARISELENIYSEECEKNQHYKQEYTRIKESDNFYAIEYMKYKEKYEQSVKKLEENKEEKNLMKIQLESLIQGYEEYKIQAKKSQERIEEMNKGRRIVEEKNEFLNSRLSEKSEELKDSRAMNLELKQDIEKIKTKENLLENEITTLTIKLRSSEKQYEANKETMQLKINSLSDIISSEKRIREDWILKFEEEQKNHSSSNRLLIATQDHHNELVLKINSLSLSLDEKNQKVNMLGVKNSEQLEEILELKAFHEELQRRNKTLQMLYENSEKERLSLIVAHKNQIDVLNELHTEVKESLLLSREELIIYGSINLQNYLKKSHEYQILQSQHSDLNKLLIKTQNDLELLKEDWNKKNMHIEDLHIVIQNTSLALSDLEEKHYILNNAYDSLNIEHQRFISLIPEDLKTVPDPFSVLAETIKQLSETLEHIEYMKSNMIDFEVQYDYIVITFDENTQTDIGFSFFEKNRRNSIAGTPQSGSQRVYSAKSKDAPATILEFPGQKKDRNLLNVSDVAFRDETPMNMKSVYNQ